jgi:hypothetical protein
MGTRDLIDYFYIPIGYVYIVSTMSFFSRKKNNEPAPDWTPFATMADFEKFIDVVKEYFDKKKMSYTIEGDGLSVQDDNWPAETMGLGNLSQMCNQRPRGEWKSIVNVHFDGMLRGKEFEDSFDKQAHDYSFAAQYIGARIYPNSYLSYLDDDAYIRKLLADDLSLLLVFDFPHTVINLKPDKAKPWNKTNEQLLEIGLANVRMNYPTKVSAEDISGARVWFLQGDHFFAANSLLDLQLYDIPTSPYGYVVAIPHRHATLVYPITTLSLIETLPTLAYIVRGMYNEGPGSISEGLYWLRDGQLTNQPYRLEGNDFEFMPTEAFLDMMNALPSR